MAAGRLDGFFEEHLKPWDTAAGVLLVTEPGGTVTTFAGDSYALTSPDILADNGLLHEALRRHLIPNCRQTGLFP